MSELIPGRYSAIARQVVLGKTSTGKEQVAAEFEILAPQSLAGKTIWWYGYFTDGAVDRTLESLEHMGWNGNGLLPADLETATTKEVSLVCEYEEYNGQKQLKVKWVNAAGGGVKEKLDDGSALALNERLKGTLLARKQNRGQSRDDTSFEFGANVGRRGGSGGPPV